MTLRCVISIARALLAGGTLAHFYCRVTPPVHLLCEIRIDVLDRAYVRQSSKEMFAVCEDVVWVGQQSSATNQ